MALTDCLLALEDAHLNVLGDLLASDRRLDFNLLVPLSPPELLVILDTSRLVCLRLLG